MVRAFLGTTLIAVLAGILGTFVILKGLALMGEAIAHASFSGLVLAKILAWPTQVGALLFGLVTAGVVTFLNRATRLKADSALVILLTGGFSLGLIGVTLTGMTGDLTALLVGQILGIGVADLYWILGAVLVTLLVMLFAFPHLVYISFDPRGAEASGLPVARLQMLLLSLIALGIVITFQAAGVILVIALLVTPAATASLFTKEIGTTIRLAILLGIIGSWSGLYLSYYLALPSGATIVAFLCLQFGLGLALRSRRPKDARPSSASSAAGSGRGHSSEGESPSASPQPARR